jgi:electron transfer flavoprotein beta subunit
MDIIVCIKQIINPETPSALFRIDPLTRRAIPARDQALVINDYDAVALESAIRIKEAVGAEVTVLSLGVPSTSAAIKHCLAMGADEGYLLSDPLFDEADLPTVAHVLAMAIKKIGKFDLIFCGRQEGDWDAGQVGLGIAEILGIPSVNPVRKIEVKDGKARVVRVVDDGYEVLEIPLPALITASSGLGEPRYPNMKGIMKAARMNVNIWTAEDIGIDASKLDPSAARVQMLDLFIPVHEGKCEFVEGETPDEIGADLFLRLKKAKLV